MKMCAGLLIALMLVLAHATHVQAGSDHRIAFVTSVTGTGDLSSWADAGGNTGLAAGDAICQARASAAGLANSGNFVAWLSDSSDDAYCRIHGLSGTKADNCGQAELPVSAGPWLRTDGFPFSDDIGGLTTFGPEVFTPLQIDEFGELVPDSIIATGTFHSGTASSYHCNNWTVGADDGTRIRQGVTPDTGVRWTSVSNPATCHAGKRLACFEREAGPDLPPFAQDGRVAFATSVAGPGDLSAWPEATAGSTGIEAGDAICQSLADTAGLAEPSTFKAWLSDSTTDAIDRFENEGGWVRVDGVPLVDSRAELTGGTLFTGITVTEQGGYLGRDRAWTGTTTSGLNFGEHCSNWTDGSDAGSGSWGFSTASDSKWTEWPLSIGCDFSQRLYCLSDAVDPLIFADRFE